MLVDFKIEVNLMCEKKKMGRPTTSPKTTQFSVRFDNETLNIPDDSCKKNNISRPEGVRNAVKKLKEKLKIVATPLPKFVATILLRQKICL